MTVIRSSFEIGNGVQVKCRGMTLVGIHSPPEAIRMETCSRGIRVGGGGSRELVGGRRDH